MTARRAFSAAVLSAGLAIAGCGSVDAPKSDGAAGAGATDAGGRGGAAGTTGTGGARGGSNGGGRGGRGGRSGNGGAGAAGRGGTTGGSGPGMGGRGGAAGNGAGTAGRGGATGNGGASGSGTAGRGGTTGGSGGVGGGSGAGGRGGLGGCLCPDIFAPVCGVDGKTYSNSCQAACNGVEIAYQGACLMECASNADCIHYADGIGDCCGACQPTTAPIPPVQACLLRCLTPVTCPCVVGKCVATPIVGANR